MFHLVEVIYLVLTSSVPPSPSFPRSIQPPNAVESSMPRAVSLLFLEWLPNRRDALRRPLGTRPLLIINFLKLNLTNEMTKTQMIGTEQYCRKLRSWQCLAPMARLVTKEVVEKVADLYFTVLMITMGNICDYIECFGILSLMPEKFAPALIDAFLTHGISPQSQSSLLTVSGYGLLGKTEDGIRKWLQLKSVLFTLPRLTLGSLTTAR